MQKYVKNLAAGYSFGHAVQIENDNSENITILYITLAKLAIEK